MSNPGRRRRRGQLAALSTADRQRRAWRRTGLPAPVCAVLRGWPPGHPAHKRTVITDDT